MRRALVLSDESAQHPFRQSLPSYVRISTDESGMIIENPRGWRLSAQDLRDFLMAYCACFLAVSAFIW